MAKSKKNPLPLSQKIEVFYLDGVWNELSDDKKFTVKQRLVEWQGIAETLENGQAITEAKEEIAASEAQNETLRQQNESLKSEIETLKSDNDILQSMLEKVNEEIQRIKKDGENADQEKQIELEEAAVQILMEISEDDGVDPEKLPASPRLQLRLLTLLLGFKETLIQHHLDEMQALGLVFVGRDWQDEFPVRWAISKEGRAYLHRVGRI